MENLSFGRHSSITEVAAIPTILQYLFACHGKEEMSAFSK